MWSEKTSSSSTSLIFHSNQDFPLESGGILPGIQIAYHVYGNLNSAKSNVIWACHGFTANSDVCDWWKGLFGKDCIFNPDEHFIVCTNILGSCYGSTGPLSINPYTGKPWYQSFPLVTVKDLVKAHILLAAHLKIERIDTLIGGSIGGQQAMEWAIAQPERLINLILLACNVQQSPWGIAFSESQRLAIQADPTFSKETPDGGATGLRAARSIALLSYRTYDTYRTTQTETDSLRIDDFKAAAYQRYQGDKLVKRFNAYSYYAISKTMDSHNIGRGRSSITDALKLIQARTLVLGFQKDVLYPTEEQRFLAAGISNAIYGEIPTKFGHDGFLKEADQIAIIIRTFLCQN